MPVDPHVLAALTPFASLAEEDLEKLAALATLEEHPGGTVLFHEEDPAVEVYFVLRGRIALTLGLGAGREHTVLTAGPGELVGFSGLLPQNRVAGARTQTSVSLLCFDGERLLALCEADHDIGYAVMKQLFGAMVRRLQDTRMQLLDVYGPRGGRS